ncbi:ATP-dependent DNA helicase PIF6-like [Macrosteles quadrilineatus]|uniref:ATP-dependent DNA helicase PIF6-like n=1 Tax=Macrosteles quadrilineatus TaxID=74068 RepID=UPI0023E31D52|nr:ATP-dependent DNA helicase PIF6-like [Macrosteles quadrilineatus]
MDDFPICILVHFDGYEGPTFNGSLPILPLTVGYRKNNVSCTRRQFPLQVVYGITAHKAQGMTVDKAVVDIGTTEFALGLTYVAMSRVRSIEGLIIEPGFSQDRLLKCINNNAGWETKRRELARLRSLIHQ